MIMCCYISNVILAQISSAGHYTYLWLFVVTSSLYWGTVFVQNIVLK